MSEVIGIFDGRGAPIDDTEEAYRKYVNLRQLRDTIVQSALAATGRRPRRISVQEGGLQEELHAVPPFANPAQARNIGAIIAEELNFATERYIGFNGPTEFSDFQPSQPKKD